MSTIYRIPFSRIRAAWVRRLVMILSFPLMVVGNWFFILLATAKALLLLPLVVLAKAIAAPFQLFGEDFTEAWNGRGPGSSTAAHVATDTDKEG